LGVTPSAWGNGVSLQGSAWALSTTTGTDASALSTNARQTAYGAGGVNWVYRTTSAAVNYEQTAGKHIWYIAPSGTAGNAITFTEAMRITSNGGVSFGSSGTAYGSSGQVLTSNGDAAPTWTTVTGGVCRAWVSFNGVSGASIRASYNVSSVTRAAIGDYTVNFSTAMQDANYAVAIGSGIGQVSARYYCGTSLEDQFNTAWGYTASSVRFKVSGANGGTTDVAYGNISIFR
jgi:hypothetical protein